MQQPTAFLNYTQSGLLHRTLQQHPTLSWTRIVLCFDLIYATVPSIYIDRPFSDAVRERCEEIARKSDDIENAQAVSDRDALYSMLSDEAQRRVDKNREQRPTFDNG